MGFPLSVQTSQNQSLPLFSDVFIYFSVDAYGSTTLLLEVFFDQKYWSQIIKKQNTNKLWHELVIYL
jgi:hypothetical protein